MATWQDTLKEVSDYNKKLTQVPGTPPTSGSVTITPSGLVGQTMRPEMDIANLNIKPGTVDLSGIQSLNPQKNTPTSGDLSSTASPELPTGSTNINYASKGAGLSAMVNNMQASSLGSELSKEQMAVGDKKTQDLQAPTKSPEQLYAESLAGIQTEDTAKLRADIYAESGIAEKKKVASDLAAKINALDAEGQVARLTLESQSAGKDVTSGFLGRQQQEIDRQLAIRKAPLVAQYQIAVGDLQGAQETASQLMSDIVTDRKTQADSKLAQIKAAYDVASAAEKKQLDAAAEVVRVSELEEQRLDAFKNSALGIMKDANDYSKLSAVMAAKTKEEVAEAVKGLRAPDSTIPGRLSYGAQAVAENPFLFSSYTKTEQGKILNELFAAGYDTSNLGSKAFTGQEAGIIAEKEKALNDIQVLSKSIEDNLNFIGPISGWQAINPWSEANQLRGDLKRVKQTVGKALEGGVLRKEDEEKYNLILPTANDTAENARYKLSQLDAAIKLDLQTYKSLLLSGGRSEDVRASLGKKGESTEGKTTSGNSYTVTKN